MKDLLKKVWAFLEPTKSLLISLGIMVVLAVGGVLFFFYVYLPANTNHGETITVPDLKGLHVDELEQFLVDRNLRYEVNADSGYNALEPPLTVLSQYPTANAQVKENRKIFLTINSENPPQVRMPNLVNTSEKNAELLLTSRGLKKGEVRYEPSPHHGVVLEQLYDGQNIPAETAIYKGSYIDLVVGDGLNNRPFALDSLVGLTMTEAEFYLAGANLRLGEVYTVNALWADPGTITRTEPAPGSQVRAGQEIDFWMTPEEPEEEDTDTPLYQPATDG